MNNVSKPIILAVDDKPELLTTLREILSNEYTFLGVTSARAALKATDVHTPQLFILDVLMPITDGFSLAKQIRAISRFKTTPIIFLTGRNTKNDITSAILSGGNDYILKPVNKELLLRKVRKYLV